VISPFLCPILTLSARLWRDEHGLTWLDIAAFSEAQSAAAASADSAEQSVSEELLHET
jgi:hypothetical protein